VVAPRKERKVRYRFPDPPHCGRTVLLAEGLAKSYGGPAVFTGIEFAVDRGERLLVMGLNGAGKTSLLRILAGESEPDEGSFRLGHDQTLRSLLGMFGLPGSIAFRTGETLSGGEKTKLALTQLVAGRRNLLLLDEPTNNLDPPSRTAVAEALQAWPGAMIIVSHDPAFVEALAPDRVLSMPEGDLDPWDEELLDLVSLT
jgi:ATPase subunit of ABC transporter with duplicated ATPase domains